MNTLFIKLHTTLPALARGEEGQDIVEYALIFALLALGATTATNFLASGLAGAFLGISTTLGNYTS